MAIMNLRKCTLIFIEVFNVRLEYIGRAQLEIVSVRLESSAAPNF